MRQAFAMVLLLASALAFAPPTSAPTPGCKNGTKPCEFAPGKIMCCTPGESCVPNVGCRCEEGDCLQVKNDIDPPADCTNGTKPCDFAPGKQQCCLPGEACVPSVGCRCDGEDCALLESSKRHAPLGIFGNPREVCTYGTLLEGPPSNDTVLLNVVTWNMEGWFTQPHLVPKQAAKMLSYKPDFIATQEDRYGWDMQKALGEGRYCFMGETRDGRSCNPSCPVEVPLSKNGGDGEHTFIYYDCTKWQVLETHTIYMGFFPDGYPRVYTNGRFQHLKTRKQIWLTSTHLPRKTDPQGQKQCLEFLLTMGDASRGSSLLMGDFNIAEDTQPSPLYKPLKERFMFDTYDVCKACRSSHTGYDKQFGTFTGYNVWVDETPDLSDHNPIIATYEL